MADLGKERDTTAEIRAAVENFFRDYDLKYEPFDENDVAKSSYRVNVKFGHVAVFFQAYSDQLIVQTIIPMNAGEEERVKVGEYLLRANYGLKFGGFDFDFRDGEILYRVTIFCGREEFSPPTHDQIDYAIAISLTMVEKYGDDLIKVMFGLIEPEDAIAAAEAND